jgi:TadE-like protein
VVWPLFMVVVFAVVQTIWWRHDRQIAIAVAQDTATAVALYDADATTADSSARARLDRAGIVITRFTITAGPDSTTVTITGRTPGVLIGTSAPITVHAVTPTERFRP